MALMCLLRYFFSNEKKVQIWTKNLNGLEKDPEDIKREKNENIKKNKMKTLNFNDDGEVTLELQNQPYKSITTTVTSVQRENGFENL
ncbi:hypothetical protein LOAG_15931, partial [Loa loa]